MIKTEIGCNSAYYRQSTLQLVGRDILENMSVVLITDNCAIFLYIIVQEKVGMLDLYPTCDLHTQF